MHQLKALSTYSYKVLIIIIIMLIPFSMMSQKKIPDDFCISSDELSLFERVNQLLVDYGKTKLQLSSSLSYVAEVHINDLKNNHPDTSICNLSSWSDKGTWTPCCYNKYVHDPDCMWDKPKELTPYPYRGYELVTYFEDGFNNDSVINLWSDSKEVLDMFLAQGDFSQKKWVCGGLAIGQNYVSMWFAQRKDTQKPAIVCENEHRGNDSLSKVIATNSSNVYYLIFGSFPSMHNAREALKKAKADDFKKSDILAKNNKIRIYLNKYSSLKEALYAKQQLPYAYREAWILKD